jgi:hypothetical protein
MSAQLPQGFNALNHNPEKGAPRLPLGLRQPVMVIDSALKGSNSNQNSGYIELMIQVLDGPNKGAIGAAIFNIFNENEKAREIANNDLAALSLCAGVPQWTNAADLNQKPFIIDVTKQRVKDGEEDKGYVEISQYYNVRMEKPLKGGGFSQPQPLGSNEGGNSGNGGGQSNNGGNSGWNTTGGGNQQQNQNQQQQQQQNNQQDQNQNQNQQQNQGGNGNGNGGWNNNQGGQQSNDQGNNGNNGGNANWNGGGNGQGNGNGNNGGGNNGTAPWNR